MEIRQKYLTVKEVAYILRRSRRTILRWINEGYLKGNKVKDGYLISEGEICRLLPEKHLNQKNDLPTQDIDDISL